MNKVTLARYESMKTCTPGALFVNDQFVCFTLELPGDGAIPSGTYRMTLATSPKFGPNIPHIHDVPGRTDILAHAGNTAKDTKGCILVGLSQGSSWIGDSRVALARLVSMLDIENEITIKDAS